MSSDGALSTAEAASRFRALQALHLVPPAFDDHFAVYLLPEDEQEFLRGEAGRVELDARRATFAIAGIGIGSLRVAEDAVVAAVADGIDQYLILGAGFDTFAARHPELVGLLDVFEVDHPDVQELKLSRLAAAPPIALVPQFVPVDFEVTTLRGPLRASRFDSMRPAVVSWMNTLPYLTEQAISTTLAELSAVLAPGSRLICNYGCRGVPISAVQLATLQSVRSNVAARGEPFMSSFLPEDFLALVAQYDFEVVEHLTESDLNQRYFAGRADGFGAGVPARIVLAHRRH